jgi:hypothetical protein
MDVGISDLITLVNIKSCEVRAHCACEHPIAVIVVKERFDAVEARRFFVDAYKRHLKIEGAWEKPQGHALLITIEPELR